MYLNIGPNGVNVVECIHHAHCSFQGKHRGELREVHALVDFNFLLIQTLSRVDHLVIQCDYGNARFRVVLVDYGSNDRTFRMAWWMGAAPRYLGRREGCILSPPSLKQEMTWGGMKKPNEATTQSWYCLDRMDSGGCQFLSVCWLEESEKERRVRHHRNLRKRDVILSTEILDRRFDQLATMLTLLVSGTDNLGP